MHMVIDDSRQYKAPSSIDHMVRAAGCIVTFYDFCDTVALYDDGPKEPPPFVDDGCIGYSCFHFIKLSMGAAIWLGVGADGRGGICWAGAT